MHPRNPYSRPPDFLALARRYPPLRPYVFLTHTGPTIDFKSMLAQRRLTEALLYLDFNISITLPDNRLCPPVPNRLNYVLWIQDVVKTLVTDDEVVRGIDIGTGASAIYPLLACRLEPKWCFIATEIDNESRKSAQQNIEHNGLSDRIVVMDVSPRQSILRPLEANPATEFHFTVCNPPFYGSADEVAQSTEAKEYGPNTVCTGAENEMITPGGEISFVSRIFMESLQHRVRCRWYTSMVGKMSSLPTLVDLLREHKVDNYAITEFVQGQTRRWAIAWSFGARRLPDCHARIASATLQNIMPSRTTLHQRISNFRSLEILCTTLREVLSAIEGVHAEWDPNTLSALVKAREITWTRSARRRKAPLSSAQVDPEGPAAMECRVSCVDGAHPIDVAKQRDTDIVLEYQWVDGNDRSVFESFVNHINRKVAAVRLGT